MFFMLVFTYPNQNTIAVSQVRIVLILFIFQTPETVSIHFTPPSYLLSTQVIQGHFHRYTASAPCRCQRVPLPVNPRPRQKLFFLHSQSCQYAVPRHRKYSLPYPSFCHCSQGALVFTQCLANQTGIIPFQVAGDNCPALEDA